MSLMFSRSDFCYYSWLDSPSAFRVLLVMICCRLLWLGATKNNSDNVLPHISAQASCLPPLDRSWQLSSPPYTDISHLLSLCFLLFFMCLIFISLCSISLLLLNHHLYFFFFLPTHFSHLPAFCSRLFIFDLCLTECKIIQCSWVLMVTECSTTGSRVPTVRLCSEVWWYEGAGSRCRSLTDRITPVFSCRE